MKRLLFAVLVLMPLTSLAAGKAYAAEVVGHESATAGWNPVHGATGYHIYYGPEKNVRAHAVKVSDRAQAITINLLSPSVSYYFQVAGIVSGKEVWQSVQKLRDAAVTTPAANKVLAAVVGNETYDVSWYGLPVSDNGNDGYQLFYKQVGTMVDNTVGSIPSQARSMTLRHLKPCTTYEWSLKSGRNGVWNWVVRGRSFTTGGVCEKSQPPGSMTPTGGPAKSLGNESARATWGPVNGARYYIVYYRLATNSRFTYAVRVPAEGTSITINHLGPGSYFYRVSALVGNQEVWLPEQRLK